jgi:two-component system OmpR family response regulator
MTSHREPQDVKVNTRATRVLVVDDDLDQLDLVERTLPRFGFTVQTATKPLEVPVLVTQLRPDVVLLDVNFPQMSGDLVVSVSRRNAPAHTRFVLYSAADETKLRSLAMTSGADAYLSKSVQGSDLARELNQILKHKS